MEGLFRHKGGSVAFMCTLDQSEQLRLAVEWLHAPGKEMCLADGTLQQVMAKCR